jgi:hypothetical protein
VPHWSPASGVSEGEPARTAQSGVGAEFEFDMIASEDPLPTRCLFRNHGIMICACVVSPPFARVMSCKSISETGTHQELARTFGREILRQFL